METMDASAPTKAAAQASMAPRVLPATEVVAALAALAHPVRLQVFRALVVRGPVGLTPGAMSEGTGVPPATISFHLKELLAAGLVTQQRASRHLIYRAEFARMSALLEYLTQNCCQGAACTVPAPACAAC
jgi:ArsR family transcriptional regulator, arsenate/arsenite/antimonite-responsive transcriptional repressor